jgi:hypothetical protein
MKSKGVEATGGCRTLHNGELHNLQSSQNIISCVRGSVTDNNAFLIG